MHKINKYVKIALIYTMSIINVPEKIMSGNTLKNNRTQEEYDTVSRRLQDKGGVWTQPVPDYATFDRNISIQKLDDVYQAVSGATDASQSEIDEAYHRSIAFAEGTFNNFESNDSMVLGREIDRAFVVPLRVDRDSDQFESDSRPFYPLLDSRFGVSPSVRFEAIRGVPPAVIDTATKSKNSGETGALVFAPLFREMVDDLRPEPGNISQEVALFRAAANIITATAIFTHHKIGAKVVGLGATIPKMTNFGLALKEIPGMESLVTTTGHGGTIYMVAETAKKVFEETSTVDDGKLGIIGGAGSIGWSTTVTAMDMFKDRTIHSYDHRPTVLLERVAGHSESDRIVLEDNFKDVIRNSNVIISAVTVPIDLDVEDPEKILDLQGKVIIDDSQPGCFDSGQIEARGGKLIWVVGEDDSRNSFATRDGLFTNGVPYNYGDKAGLYGEKSDFGCGLEAAVIAKYSAYEDAIRGEVTPDNVKIIGKHFKNAGIRVAPFQAASQPVNID